MARPLTTVQIGVRWEVKQNLGQKLRELVVLRPVPSRWWYLPFLLLEGGLAFFALAGGLPGGYTYLALSLIFLAQTSWPSILGWWAAFGGWFSIEFLLPLHDRLVYGIPGFSPGFLIGWGLLPLVFLYFVRPRPGTAPTRPDITQARSLGTGP